MDKLAFGLTMMIVGIGGTFLTLGILIWSIELLKKLFPLEPAQAGSTGLFFSLDRIPPHWREKIPVEAIRLQWNQRLASMQAVHHAWRQKLPVKPIRAHWSAVHARMFGRNATPPSLGSAPPHAPRDQTRPS